MPVRELAACLPETLRAELLKNQEGLTEVRLRGGRRMQLVYGGSDRFIGEPTDVVTIRRIALKLMDQSYHTHENELSEGFFTMRSGCRVGVCGSYMRSEKSNTLHHIGSMCVRIAREVCGSADELITEMLKCGRAQNTLILSRPGMGKTTILRDAARQLSEIGYRIAIADERHEIAACRDGLPLMNVGERTDVLDGIAKAKAMEMLLRSMAPQIIIADEIGNADDAGAIRELVRRGVIILTTAHASGFDALKSGMLSGLIQDGLFSIVVLLDESPGRICGFRRYGGGSEV